MEYVLLAAPTLISAVVLGVVAYTAKKVVAFIREFKGQHAVLMESQRNQLKASIVETYERVVDRGHITPMELETVNREFDSYKALGGNHYIHALIKHMNEMPVMGEAIPAE